MEARRFIRHPSRMPLHFDVHGGVDQRDEYLRNVSEGGLCFASAIALPPGQRLRLTIPVLGQRFEIDGRVAWCRPGNEGYEIGVSFFDPQDRFAIRMVEQLCYVEAYRRQVAQDEGRELSREQAAEEWIERFADQFPVLQ
jgi:hypothetical protein